MFTVLRNTHHARRALLQRFILLVTVLSLPHDSVAKEEPVEEHVTFSAGEITLEGLFSTSTQTPTIGAVVCHPHPLYGGEIRTTMSSPR